MNNVIKFFQVYVIHLPSDWFKNRNHQQILIQNLKSFGSLRERVQKSKPIVNNKNVEIGK